MRLLTHKQTVFVQTLVETDSVRQAVQKAGLSSTQYGHILLKRPHIQQAIAAEREARARAARLTAEEVIENLRRLLRGAEAAGQYTAAVLAARHLGEALGLFDGAVRQAEQRRVFVIREPVLALPASATRLESSRRDEDSASA